MKRKLIALLLTLAMLVTSMAALSGSLAASAAAATRGDLNGDDSIDMKDVLLLRKFIAGIGELSDETAADVNDDGGVDMKDVLLLRKHIAGFDVSLAPIPDVSEESSADDPSADEPSTESSVDEPVGTADELTPDQITMTYYDPDCTQYGITWHTYKRSGAPTVQFVKGATTEAADFADATTIAGETTKYQSDTMPYDPETNTVLFANLTKMDDYVHRAVLADLEYNTSYSYRVGDADADVWSAIATFTTRPETVNGFSFIEITDTQNSMGDASQYTATHTYMRDALEKAFSQVENPAFILHGGDFVEASMLLSLWRSMLNGNRDFLMSTPLMMVCGNHDSTYKASDYEQIKHFNVGVDTTDMNTKLGIYYSYDYGNAHFVVLNSNSTSKRTDGTDDNASLDQKQLAWLKADLEANTKEWTIVTEHHPVFAPIVNSNDEKPVRQAQLMKLLNDNHVDLFIQSHEHLYMRTYPMDANARPLKDTATVTEDGVTYLKDPGAPIFFMAGKTSKSGDAPYGDYDPAPFAKISTGKPSSYSIVTIEGGKLTVKANYVEGGQVKSYETFGIIHSAG